MRYVAVAAGNNHTVLLRDDGAVEAVGAYRYGQIDVPPGVGRVWEVVAGTHHTVLLLCDGGAVAFGVNEEGQCDVPALEPGERYVAGAAGAHHTVLLTAAGRAVGFGAVPGGALPQAARYLAAATGPHHTLLITAERPGAVACGDPVGNGHLDVPELTAAEWAAGVRYVAAAAGSCHSVLLRSDGRAVAFGDNEKRMFQDSGACDVPELEPGAAYVAVGAGISGTVLLRSDGRAVACGEDMWGELELRSEEPYLRAGARYVPAGWPHAAADLWRLVAWALPWADAGLRRVVHRYLVPPGVPPPVHGRLGPPPPGRGVARDADAYTARLVDRALAAQAAGRAKAASDATTQARSRQDAVRDA